MISYYFYWTNEKLKQLKFLHYFVTSFLVHFYAEFLKNEYIVTYLFWRNLFFFQWLYKEYFPNLPENLIWGQILFIELSRYFKFWLLAFFSFCWTLLSLRKIGQHLYYTFYKGPPFEFLVNYKNKKTSKGGPL